MSSELEGGHSAKLYQMISNIGYNKDVDFEIGTVLSPYPDIEIQLDGDNIVLDAGDLVLAQRLCDHTITMTQVDGTTGEPTTGGELTFKVKSPLNVGDEVIVASFNNGVAFIVLDKVGGDE